MTTPTAKARDQCGGLWVGQLVESALVCSMTSHGSSKERHANWVCAAVEPSKLCAPSLCNNLTK
ncbi:MAG: hypothetical protein FWD76_00255 [Firmicutes bacterium]|nr:hypothetical protein [Bacillota bacterium]